MSVPRTHELTVDTMGRKVDNERSQSFGRLLGGLCMSLRRRRYLLAPVGVLLLATGALARVGDDVNLTRVTTLGPQETLSQANDYMSKIRSTESRVLVLKQTAEKKKDVL